MHEFGAAGAEVAGAGAAAAAVRLSPLEDLVRGVHPLAVVFRPEFAPVELWAGRVRGPPIRMAKHKGLRALFLGGVGMSLSWEKSQGQGSPSGDCRDWRVRAGSSL